MLGYIPRNFKDAPNKLKRLLYVTLVRPKLEYASAIWHPHQKVLVDLIESVQSRAARFILNDHSRLSSVTSMKSVLDLPLLSLRRRSSRLYLLHKIIYTPILKTSLLSPPAYTSSRIDNSCKIARPKSYSQAHQHSFLPDAVVDWNGLPDCIVTLPNNQDFRSAITMYITHSPL